MKCQYCEYTTKDLGGFMNNAEKLLTEWIALALKSGHGDRFDASERMQRRVAIRKELLNVYNFSMQFLQNLSIIAQNKR